MCSGLYAINRSKHILTQKHLRTLYYSLVHPHLNYGTLIWGSAAKTHVRKIEIMQNKAVRAITNSAYNASTKPLYTKLKILPLNSIYKHQIGKLMLDTQKIYYLNLSNHYS